MQKMAILHSFLNKNYINVEKEKKTFENLFLSIFLVVGWRNFVNLVVLCSHLMPTEIPLKILAVLELSLDELLEL